MQCALYAVCDNGWSCCAIGRGIRQRHISTPFRSKLIKCLITYLNLLEIHGMYSEKMVLYTMRNVCAGS